MKPFLIVVGLCGVFSVMPAGRSDGQRPDSNKLPSPLDSITADFSAVENLFRVAEVRLYAPNEFRVGEPERIVADETIVWTLEAKVPLTGAQIHRLFHNPRPQVSFFRRANDKDVNVDARADGYQVICDLRWFSMRPSSPDLTKGQSLKVWVHLGKKDGEGSSGLVANGAVKMTLKMD
jgi:hypothetical protein